MRYDILKTYAWNYQHAPEPVTSSVVERIPGRWEFCGLPVPSPLGIPAGPLLNAQWVLYYASLGFDVLTYKTVRSVARECYPLPNLLPVDCDQLRGDETDLATSATMSGSWAVSFGMPSKSPDVWRADVRLARAKLPPEKILSVSVVGSMQDGWTIDDLAADYAQCAEWAIDSGANCIEANLSCPNVDTCDGQLYQHPRDAATVMRHIRTRIGDKPLIAKIGHIEDAQLGLSLLEHLQAFVDACAITNSIATTVVDATGQRQFDGQRRGICGAGTREASIRQTELLSQLVKRHDWKTRLIGVGGVQTAEDVRRYLAAGAHAVQLATSAMIDPQVGIAIRREWDRPPHHSSSPRNLANME